MDFKYKFSAAWQLIFFHNSTTGLFFDETKIQSIDDDHRYSIMGSINEKYKRNGYFEYLIEYPEVPGYNRWKQQKSIADTEVSDNATDIGFKPIHIDFHNRETPFEGLSKSNTRYTIYDGSPAKGASNSGFWFSIGATGKYNQKNQFPGPYYGTVEDGVTLCYLWIKVCDAFVTCHRIFHFSFIYPMLFMTISLK